MFEGKVILVVDDEVDLREILRDELEFEGAQVYEASNGQEALQKIMQMKFDAVLSDIRMPGGDGTTLAHEVRKIHPSQPVLVLITGFADLKGEEAYSLGADGYVTKPFHLEELKQMLLRLLTPPKSRWEAKPKGDLAKIVMPQDFIEAIDSGVIAVGRGGMFLKGDPDHFRVGDLVELQFKDFRSIQAQVRWVRGHKGAIPAGLGLEFLQVSESVVENLQSHFPNWMTERSFIPKN